MQATCPKCSQIIAVDDAKVPPGPFMLRCPNCQETMKMPGSAAAKAPMAAETKEPSPPPRNAAQSAPAPAARKEPVFSAPTQSASDPSTAQESVAGNGSLRALVYLPGTDHSDAVSSLLERLGYRTEYIDIWDQKVEEIHQERYHVIVTHRNGASPRGERDLFKLLNMLPPETRRRIFIVLVGEEFKTGNGTQAFTVMADLVCHPRDLDSADILLRSTVAERARFYRAFLEVEDNL